MFDLDRFCRQSPYSTLGRYADRLAALPDDLMSLCAASRNVIAHYRTELPDLPEERRGEIDSRWLETILALDQHRHPARLNQLRPVAERVAGCCRDHSLLVVGALRQRGVAARNRIGFAHYFTPGWASDHVIVELWQQGRWQRADPELGPDFPFDVHDIPAGQDAPFETAAEAWLGWRAGSRDLSTYGVEADPVLTGPDFVRTYVMFEVAHRYGDEMLLWDGWHATEEPPDVEVIDELAQLLVRADAADNSAETTSGRATTKTTDCTQGTRWSPTPRTGYPHAPPIYRLSGTSARTAMKNVPQRVPRPQMVVSVAPAFRPLRACLAVVMVGLPRSGACTRCPTTRP